MRGDILQRTKRGTEEIAFGHSHTWRRIEPKQITASTITTTTDDGHMDYGGKRRCI